MAVMSLRTAGPSAASDNSQDETGSQHCHDADAARRLELRFLVRRFEIQLRYGCNAQECKSAHCHTTSKHGYRKPARRPSPLAARLVAFHLAASSDPYSKLCKARLPVLPQQLDAAPEVLARYPWQSKELVPVELVRCAHPGSAHKGQKPDEAAQPSEEVYRGSNASTIKDYWQQSMRLSPGSQPDRKSLMQNIFASKAVRSFLWGPSRSNADSPELHFLLGMTTDQSWTSVELRLKDHQEGKWSMPRQDLPVKHQMPTFPDVVRLKNSYDAALLSQSPTAISEAQRQLYLCLRNSEGLSSFLKISLKESQNLYLAAFRYKDFRDDTIMLRNLHHALDAVFVPPHDWTFNAGVPPTVGVAKHLSDEQAIHVLSVCWLALVAWVWPGVDRPSVKLTSIRKALSKGCMYEDRNFYKRDGKSISEHVEVLDAYGDITALTLATKLMYATGVRNAFINATDSSTGSQEPCDASERHVMRRIPVPNFPVEDGARDDLTPGTQVVNGWMLAVVNHTWNGKLIIDRWSATGAALDYLDATPNSCLLHWMERRLPGYNEDDLLQFVNDYGKNVNTVHLWSLPALFPVDRQVRTFRALNYARMSSAYKQGIYTEQLSERLHPAPQPEGQRFLDRKLQTASSRYLVFNVRREHLLEDALDQLWSRERRELMRPLKIRMGMDVGEAGVDQGGISQEFFRLVYAKAFDPAAGLFTKTDDDSTCLWPRPGGHEPLVTFQLLGLLTALGLYNGFTLPISFPYVFYVLLCRDSTSCPGNSAQHSQGMKLSLIKDAWPTLYNSLDALRTYDVDRIEDDLALDWTFTFSWNEDIQHVDMYKAMQSRNSSKTKSRIDRSYAAGLSAEPVTGANRSQYISEYLRWTIKEIVHDEMAAFAHGFKAVVDDAALSMLTPITLKSLVEGDRYIDIKGLKSITKLEGGYSWDHPLIIWFWEIVLEDYLAEQHRALLNFVTAIDRTPVSGVQNMKFSICKNGSDSELLPSSATCVSKLMLPEYATKEKLKAKLDIALQHTIGFGSA